MVLLQRLIYFAVADRLWIYLTELDERGSCTLICKLHGCEVDWDHTPDGLQVFLKCKGPVAEVALYESALPLHLPLLS